jgi:hypothetical protein
MLKYTVPIEPSLVGRGNSPARIPLPHNHGRSKFRSHA